MSFGFGFLPKLNFHRGPYTSANVLLNLINELWEGNKIRGLPIDLSLFRNEFIKFNNVRARILESMFMTLKIV